MISAIIPAAGRSTRMGHPKMLLPWGTSTVVEHVISVFAKVGVKKILVITGRHREEVEAAINPYQDRYRVRSIFNENYMEGEMLSSIQCGLHALMQEKDRDAVLIGLGDQPQIEEGSVRSVCEAFLRTQSPIIVPSFRMRRGHPWLVAHRFWNDIMELQSPKTLRDFLNQNSESIHYVNVDTPSILADMDTPDDYIKSQPLQNHD